MTKEKKIPMRKCVGCGQMKPKKELIRVIRTPEGEVLMDATGRANGRGAYLCRSSGCFEKAVKTKSLQRSLEVPIDQDTLTKLQEAIGKIETG